MMVIVRLLAAAGLGISAYLAILKANGTISSIAGCGDAGGCENVLGSRWSEFLGIPVSVLAIALYFIIFFLSFSRQRFLFLVIGCLLITSAVWFTALQFFVIKSFCPWCLAMHAIGLCTGLLLVRRARRIRRDRWAGIAMGTGATVALIVGQIFGPRPETHEVVAEKTPALILPVYQRGEGRLVDFAGSQYRVASLPHLGPSDATHFLVKYYDYTCDACRQMDQDLQAVLAKHPSSIGVILLPTPLHRQCNKHLPPKVKDHTNACELARLALALWQADPENFADHHERLFARPIPKPKLLAESLDLELDLEDPWIDELIAANTAAYATLVKKTPRMPKLRLRDNKVLQGLTRTPEELLQIIERTLALP